MSLTYTEQREILNEVSYKDWTFKLTFDYLQVSFTGCDGTQWSGRKWKLSDHMTKSELVQTALKAVLTAEEHESREQFRYKGRTLFGPHLDVDALLEIADRVETRPSA